MSDLTQPQSPLPCPLAGALAIRLRDARDELTSRWLQRISARVTLDANRMFPGNELLDHVPILIDGIASYVENPADAVGTDMPVIAKAMELGDMRHQQGFDAYQILKEYEILGSVLFTFLADVVDEVALPCTRAELLQCGHRVFHAVALIQQATAMQFLRQTQARVRDRENRLRSFNRMVSHELKNRIGAASGAVRLLEESWLEAGDRQRFFQMSLDNLDAVTGMLEDLVALSRLEQSTRQQRNVRLSEAVGEVRRRLREFARARGVTIDVDEPLPAVEVNAAAVELCLTNYISNGIKYCDPDKSRRWVRVGAAVVPTDGSAGAAGTIVVEVRDNGLGIPAEARDHLFERFFRAHEETSDADGTGLGLSIVRETIEALGGRAWARNEQERDPDEPGSVFAFSIPSRRSSETRRADSMSEERSSVRAD